MIPRMTHQRLAVMACRRRPFRSAVTCTGVALAVATAFSMLSFLHGYQQGLWRELDRLGAHILVVPKGCPYEAASLALHGASWPCYLKSSYLDEIRAVDGIATVAPVLMSAHFGRDAQSTVYLGIETNLLSLKPGWTLRGHFPRTNEVLLGAAAALAHGWFPGASIPLPGLRNHHATVSGIIDPTGTSEDRFLYLPLLDAQHRLAHTNQFTHALVRLADPGRIDSVVRALRGCDAGMQMNVVPLAHLFRSINALASSTRGFLYCVTLAACLASAAGLTATLLIAVDERSREIGILRALGASQADIRRLILLEALLLSAAGAALGILAAFASVRVIEDSLRRQLPFVPSGPLVTWEWWIATVCILLALLVGAAAGLLPAQRAARIMPSEAMRRKHACD